MVRKKDMKRTLTHEELQEQKLKIDWLHLEERLQYIPEPTILYEVGQPVYVGSLIDCTIDKVFENGKVYQIDYTQTLKKSARHDHTPLKNCKQLVTWLDISTGGSEDTDLRKKDDIRISYHQTELRGLIGKVYSFGVDFEPEYQREHIWELDDKVALIDSIFNNIDIGKFSFIFNDDEKWRKTGLSYEILDGKQRLTALCEFYEGRFEYKGYKFRELSKKDRHHFLSYVVNLGEVRDATEQQVIEYFIKLNTHGRIMSQDHLDKVRKMIK